MNILLDLTTRSLLKKRLKNATFFRVPLATTLRGFVLGDGKSKGMTHSPTINISLTRLTLFFKPHLNFGILETPTGKNFNVNSLKI